MYYAFEPSTLNRIKVHYSPFFITCIVLACLIPCGSIIYKATEKNTQLSTSYQLLLVKTEQMEKLQATPTAFVILDSGVTSITFKGFEGTIEWYSNPTKTGAFQQLQYPPHPIEIHGAYLSDADFEVTIPPNAVAYYLKGVPVDGKRYHTIQHLFGK